MGERVEKIKRVRSDKFYDRDDVTGKHQRKPEKAIFIHYHMPFVSETTVSNTFNYVEYKLQIQRHGNKKYYILLCFEK